MNLELGQTAPCVGPAWAVNQSGQVLRALAGVLDRLQLEPGRLMEVAVADLPLTMACGPYDRTEALADGTIRPEGIDLTYLAITSPPEIFARMIKTDSFDISEMSLSHYLVQRSQGPWPFIALPVFPSRLFRHGFIFINARAGIAKPKDLEGRRIGVQEYRQTAAVWIRGLLAQEYGVDLGTVEWFEGGVNAPRRPDEAMDLRPDQAISIEVIDQGKCLNDMLASGEIDAYLGARRPDALGRAACVERLIPNYREAERAYYAKTGIFPIMHTLVMRQSLYEEKPWIAESLFKACSAAKTRCLKEMRFSGAIRYMTPWLYDDLEEMDALMGENPWPYGLEANRKTLETIVRYLDDQGFLAGPVAIEDMFTPIAGSEG